MHFPIVPIVPIVIAAIAHSASAAKIPSNFFLVTTTQSTPARNSSHLANVAGASLFDPYYQINVLVRIAEPGEGDLPQFNLTKGTLQTFLGIPHAEGIYQFNATKPEAGVELQFLRREAPARGTIGLRDGYLLTVAGAAKGWKICPGDFEQRVVFWKGTDPGCVDTYIHAVTKAP